MKLRVYGPFETINVERNEAGVIVSLVIDTRDEPGSTGRLEIGGDGPEVSVNANPLYHASSGTTNPLHEGTST